MNLLVNIDFVSGWIMVFGKSNDATAYNTSPCLGTASLKITMK